MAVLSVILLILFVLVSLLLIFIVAIQSEDNTGLGGVFGGSSESAFGGQTNKVINKITSYLIIAFFVFALLIGFINKSSGGSVLREYSSQRSAEQTVEIVEDSVDNVTEEI